MTPSPLRLPSGCSFRSRCPRADERCREMPELVALETGRLVRCVHPLTAEAP
ncbi:MAG TPA: oligopeptide/dipeptide ABC transporter ATP-binding protein [Stellaceae bacterium]|nr:oligopeptide/dipeptide ABC transporter ATP-binding protein [Stellaceae bacterium]